MRIYATSRKATLKEPLAMIGLVVVADIVMILILVHALHRTVSVTAQWPIALLIAGVIGWGIRSFNLAGRRWVEVTPKQLSWAAGKGAVKSGFTKSGSVKLAELSSVSVELDEFPVKDGRKDATFRAHRLHAQITGKPAIVLPVFAEVLDESATAEARAAAQARLLSVVEQIDTHAKKITLDTSALDVEEVATEDTAAEDITAEATETEAVAEVTEVETEEVETTEVEETETVESEEVTESEAVAETETETETVSETESAETEEVVETAAVKAEATSD